MGPLESSWLIAKRLKFGNIQSSFLELKRGRMQKKRTAKRAHTTIHQDRMMMKAITLRGIGAADFQKNFP